MDGWCFAVDERPQPATGCSIDASVSALKQVANLHPSMVDLDLFDRMAVLHRSSADTPWKRTQLPTFWAQRKAGLVGDAEQVFDTTVCTLGALKTRGWFRWGLRGTPRCGEPRVFLRSLRGSLPRRRPLLKNLVKFNVLTENRPMNAVERPMN